MKRFSIIAALTFLSSITQAKEFHQESISYEIYLHESILIVLGVISILYSRKLGVLMSMYKITLSSIFAGIVGSIICIISIYSKNINYNDYNLIIISSSTTAMFLGMLLNSSYKWIGVWISAYISYYIGTVISNIIIFKKIPGIFIILGIVFISLNFLVVLYNSYKPKKA